MNAADEHDPPPDVEMWTTERSGSDGLVDVRPAAAVAHGSLAFAAVT
jgi:hypothetical protein